MPEKTLKELIEEAKKTSDPEARPSDTAVISQAGELVEKLIREKRIPGADGMDFVHLKRYFNS